jgi:hypothetical protein
MPFERQGAFPCAEDDTVDGSSRPMASLRRVMPICIEPARRLQSICFSVALIS